MVSVGERAGLLPAGEFEWVERDGGMEITRTSIFTRNRNTMFLPIQFADFARWRCGDGLVQDVFPQLNADQREFLMSGATPEEWEAMFG